MMKPFEWLRSQGRRRQAFAARLQVEALENRLVPANTAPTLAPIANVTVPAGQTFQLPLDGNDVDGDSITYSFTSSNSNVTAALAPGSNHFIKINVTGVDSSSNPFTGDIVFELFDDLAPITTARIMDLVNSDFYDSLTFHRILQDFVAQGGDPLGDGTGGSQIKFNDEFNTQLRFNGFGQLAMANAGDDDNDSQFFITDVDLSLAAASTKQPPQHLNFQHTIFGQMVQGFDVFTKLISTPVTSPVTGTPTSPPIINSITVIEDTQDAVLRISAPEGFTGSSTFTVTGTDGHGGKTTRTFQVSVIADTVNERPFLGDSTNNFRVALPPSPVANDPNNQAFGLATTVNTPLVMMLPRTDTEHDQLVFGVSNALPVDATATIDAKTGLLTVTPPTDFTGTIYVRVSVRDQTDRDPAGFGLEELDSQLLKITVGVNEAPTAADQTVSAFKNADKAIVVTGTDGDAVAVQHLSFTITNLPTNGTLLDANGDPISVGTPIPGRDPVSAGLTYVPNDGTTGQDSFTFTVQDDGGTDGVDAADTSSEATVTITVADVVANPRITVVNHVLKVVGGTGNDVVSVVLNHAGDRLLVSLNSDPVQSIDIHEAGVDGILIQGNKGNDKITVGETVDKPATIQGGVGNDTLTGGMAADLIQGGAGNDLIFGNDGNDTLKGNGGSDTLVGAAGNDRLQGGDGLDTMDGGQGTDVLLGGRGADSMMGGIGNDTVTGGPGADRFAPGDTDVTDFNPAVDVKVKDDDLETAFKLTFLKGVRTFEIPGALSIDSEATGFQHTATGTDTVDYSKYSNPPTYGPHHPFDAGVTPVPVPTGVYTDEQADEDLVHNLEHGHVWISYRPDLIGADDLAALQALVRSFGLEAGVVLTPRQDNNSTIAVTSWGHLSESMTVNLDDIRTFILTNRGYGREGFITP